MIFMKVNVRIQYIAAFVVAMIIRGVGRNHLHDGDPYYKDKPLAINTSYSCKWIYIYIYMTLYVRFFSSLNGYTTVWPRENMCTEINATFPPLSSKWWTQQSCPLTQTCKPVTFSLPSSSTRQLSCRTPKVPSHILLHTFCAFDKFSSVDHNSPIYHGHQSLN